MVCGPLRGRDGGPVKKVVVAGGFDGSEYLSSVEVYDVASNTWTYGVDLPVPLAYAAVVPFENTFLVIGGITGRSDQVYHKSDKVYRYNTPESTWTEMRKLRLREPKSQVTAMWVP